MMAKQNNTLDHLSFAKQADDGLEVYHLGDYLGLPRLESTYKIKSGALTPDGPSSPPRQDRHDMGRLFVHDEDRVLVKVVHYAHPTSAGIEMNENGEWQFKPMWARRAGPRALIYFQPQKVKAAMLTSGGLCPGLNDVIRQIVCTLEVYGVSEILGIQYGFRGFSDPNLPPITLDRKTVQRVHMQGGSFLGVTRGHPKISDLVDKLEAWKVNMLFVIGGNGSHAGAHAIFKEVWARKLKLAVVGVPKTIDNDFLLLDKSFGFDTAVEEAQRAINAAYVEASSAYNGVGIVKLMGRQSGFITMHATLASGQVDLVLIPEVPFEMEGNNGVLAYMKKRLEKNGICVVVIAEGAGQEHLEKTGSVDASGNVVLADVGKWFYNQVKAYFGKIKVAADLKYIDPTYMIRARPCNSADHIFCTVLGQNAVHAAFAGYTDVTVGLVNTHYCLLPIPVVIKHSRTVDPNSNMWHRCVTSTGQPEFCNSTAMNPSTGARPAASAGPHTASKPSTPPVAKPPTALNPPCYLYPKQNPQNPALARPATAPLSQTSELACQNRLGCRFPVKLASDKILVKVFLHYCKGKPSECVGVLQTSAGVFEWPSIVIQQRAWEAGGATLVQALLPTISSWYNDITGAKALQSIFLTYAGIIEGHAVAQLRLPATSHNKATWSGGLMLLHPDVLESRMHVPIVPSVRSLTGNPCKF